MGLKNYNCKWPDSLGLANYIGLNEEGLSRLHLHFFKAALRATPYIGKDLCSIDNEFVNLVCYVAGVFNSRSIDTIIFGVAPHSPIDSVIYGLAKLLKLEIVICYQSIIKGTFFAVSNLESPEPVMIRERPFEIPEEFLSYSDAKLDLFYMKGQKAKHASLYKMVLKPLAHNFHRGPIKRARAKRTLSALITDVKLYREWKKFQSSPTLSIESLPEKYIYVPLHLQPEATTSALGGPYYNQLMMINQLRSVIPKQIRIVVKENPKQGLYGRGLGFYQRLRSVENLSIADGSISSMELARRALATATISGTAGWEALRLKRPTIYFGQPWYKALYGAFPFKKDIYLTIRAFEPDEVKFRDSILRLSYQMHPGFISMNYFGGQSNSSIEENLQVLKQSFGELLKNADRPISVSYDGNGTVSCRNSQNLIDDA